MTRPLCRHCQVNVSYRPRGLCEPCYLNLEIRHAYGPITDFGRRGVGNGNGGAMASCATTERPGTAGKIGVLSARAQRGEGVFHPGDYHYD